MAEHDKSLDIFGTKPIAEAGRIVTEASVRGASAFLGRICLPAAEEFGLLLQDKVRGWRAQNAARIALKAERLLEGQEGAVGLHAHPRLVGIIVDQGSWADEDDVQEIWAGLLASSCTNDGKEQVNLIFLNYLAQLTGPQVRLLSFACETADKQLNPTGLVIAKPFQSPVDDLMKVMHLSDLHEVDLQVDHLRELGLMTILTTIVEPLPPTATLHPSAIGLQLYARASGRRVPPAAFYNLEQG